MTLTRDLIHVQGEMLGIIINNATEAAEMLRGYFSWALEPKGRMGPSRCAVGCVEREGGPA